MRLDISELPFIASRAFLGGEVAWVEDDGSDAAVRFNPPEGARNPNNTVQGGLAGALIDDVVSMATFFAGGGRPFVTTNLSCYFLKPIPMEATLLARSTLVKSGRTQALFEATLSVEGDETILVKASQMQQYLS